MKYEEGALQILLASSTISILLGSLFVMIVGNLKIWGPEAVRLSALGISGVAIFTLALVILPSPLYGGDADFGSIGAFLQDPHTPAFIGTLVGSSFCSGMFVVPLQAMAQRRAFPEIRARLMSAGSVLLNLFVNVTTFGLIGLAAMSVAPKVPFYIIIVGSLIVGAYAIYRSFKLVQQPQPGVSGS